MILTPEQLAKYTDLCVCGKCGNTFSHEPDLIWTLRTLWKVAEAAKLAIAGCSVECESDDEPLRKALSALGDK